MARTPSTEIPRHKRLDAALRQAMTQLDKVAGLARDGTGGGGVGETESAGLEAIATEMDEMKARAREIRHRLWELVG